MIHVSEDLRMHRCGKCDLVQVGGANEAKKQKMAWLEVITDMIIKDVEYNLT